MNLKRTSCYTLLGSMLAVSMLTGPASAQESWQQTHKLFASNAAPGDWFGGAVGISGDWAIVGSYRWFAGQAYLFDATTGEQLHRLIPWDGADSDYFGRSVAIGGDTVVIGAPGNESGCAYVIDATSGELRFQLWPSDGQGGDFFACSVAIDGNRIVIGSRDDDNSGSAYVFDRETGEELRKLVPADGSFSDRFGVSVAVSGHTAVVGANWDDDNGQSSGSAYVFDTETGEQLFKLLPTDGLADDQFGTSVGIGGNLSVIGAPMDDADGPNFGSAYVFNTVTGEQVVKLIPDDAAIGDWFGSSVATDGNRALIGAIYDDHNGSDSGSAYVFDLATGTQLSKLLPTDGDSDDNFGAAVAIGGDSVVIGAPLDEDRGLQSGSAYLFERIPLFSFDVTGPCPGTLTVSWQDARPNSLLALVFSFETGSFEIPFGPCAGTVLGLGPRQIRLVNTFGSSRSGSGSRSGSAGPSACGGYLQLLDIPTCGTSNVVQIR